jgi:GT2 family glycosyltransferase
MLNYSEVEIVVVPRERYQPTISSLERLVAATPPEVPIVLVRGGMPDRMVRVAQVIGGSRLRVVGPRRHLAPNAARSIGLGHVTAKFVMFLDNDVSCDPGWLQPLIETAVDRGAWAVRPIILQRVGDKVTIHEVGGDCRLESREGALCLIESHRHMGKSLGDISGLRTEPVEMFEFHAVLFDRDRLLSLDGPDEAMLAQGDHLDLGIRVHEAGGEIWIEPSSQVIYEVPSKVAIRDLPFFLGRWSPRWAKSSRDAFVAKHKIDPDQSSNTWSFPDKHRTHAWRFIARLCRTLYPRSSRWRFVSKIDKIFSRIIDRVIGRFISEACLRFAPRWRGAGLRGDS